ncbi:Gfo/Idh/MocA family oxidoreductase [Chelativorans sp. Marseille-P2723]|uniref:Gfo/Idh/MocA family protein n=1 Tax=Chelativorans sp. Marseille-P2723 TaxID=2709133 RepID=UPI00156DBE30|nr:Gfo/Idh/MocA family oxidoreductase [Chelativorans sp. Marseille-P2723]
MKVVFAGVSHWHTPLYLEPLLRLESVQLSGVCDPDAQVAASLANRYGCISETSLERLCASARPDLAFVLGKHSAMAESASYLIGERIPFVIEKPAGIGAGEVEGIAREAEKAGVFAAVPLVFRSSGFMQAVRETAGGEKVLYAGFKFIAGLTSRYREAGCEWMFDRQEAGGGSLTNLGVHFLDLMQVLTSVDDTSVSSAEFMNFSGEGNVEDFAAVTLRNGGALGHVETGYLYPAPTGIFDMHFSVRTENHYFTATGPGAIDICDLAGNRRRIAGTTTNIEIYPQFVRDVVRRLREGLPPVADLSDMAKVVRLLDSAYATGGKSGEKRGTPDEPLAMLEETAGK